MNKVFEKMPYNLEYENVNYTLVEQVDKNQFLHNFLDKKYRGDCMFVILNNNSDRPNKNIHFRDAINDKLGIINDYYGHCEFAVYDRMTKLQMPEINCGNCKHLVRHYSASDNLLGFSILGEGHCIKTNRAKTRQREDKPYKNNCFEWNDQCRHIVEQIN